MADGPPGPVRHVVETPQGTWIRPGDRSRADALLAAFAGAGRHARAPADYADEETRRAVDAAAAGDRQARARAERLLTAAYLRWAHDLHTPPAGAVDLPIADPDALLPPPDPRRLVGAAAAAPDMARHLERLQQRHPFYRALSARLGALDPDDPRAGAVKASLERARLLPAEPAGAHIVVDIASARLWMVEDGAVVGRMKVIVGKPDSRTPLAAGMIRLAIGNPYWNMPVDLAQQGIARRVVAHGPGQLARERLQLLSDWTDRAVPIPASRVDWKAVAEGRAEVRVRQLPGPGNMMGAMKFPFENDLGIYLHDTPERAPFDARRRTLSAGCVRVEDWKRLADFLRVPPASGAAEERLPLPRPVPVYLTYLTVDPERPARQVADVYGLEPGLAQPASRSAAGAGSGRRQSRNTSAVPTATGASIAA